MVSGLNEMLYPIAVIGITAIVTWGLRAFPFLLFSDKTLPGVIKYLGYVLPPAIMTILVIYCLRNTEFGQFPFGIPELFSCILVVGIHLFRRNMYLSIVAGTLCYMLLIRIL